MFLGAGGAALEVRSHPGDLRVGIRAGDLRLDVDIELIEALLAGQLGSCGPEQPPEQAILLCGL